MDVEDYVSGRIADAAPMTSNGRARSPGRDMVTFGEIVSVEQNRRRKRKRVMRKKKKKKKRKEKMSSLLLMLLHILFRTQKSRVVGDARSRER